MSHLRFFMILVFQKFYQIKYDIFIVACLCLIGFNAFASNINFKKIHSKTFPSNKVISSIAFDKKGLLWLASKSNLWSFDGFKLKPYQHLLPLHIKKIKKLHFDKSGKLWIGTQHSGLIKLDVKESLFLTKKNSPLSSNLVSSLADGDSNGMWVGTSNGLNYVTKNNVITNYPYVDSNGNLSDIYITSILNISQGKLLIATKKALFEFNKSTKSFIQIKLLEESNSEIVIFNLVEGLDKNIWVASDKGVFLKKHGSSEFIAFMPELLFVSITSIVVEKESIWFGSLKDGLFKLSKNNRKLVKYTHNPNNPSSLSDNSVITLVKDSYNNIWVNTFRGGLNFVNKNSISFGKVSHSELSSICGGVSDVLGFSYRNQSLWITTLKGLIEYNKVNGSCEFHFLDGNNNPSTNFLYSANYSSNENIWLSTTNGLNKFNLSTNAIDTSYQKQISSITRFTHNVTDNLLLVGTKRGLFLFDVDKRTKKRIADEKYYFHSIWKNNNNTYYFATNCGIGFLDNEQQFTLNTTIQDQLPTKDTVSIYISSQGDLWVGTNGYGLFQFNEDDKLIKKFVDIKGMPKDSTFNSILEDDINNIWVGTSDGLLRIDSNSKTHVFHESDGLQSDFFYLNSAYKDQKGKLYFGGSNGYNAFYPKDIKINKTPPNIVLTDFTRFGQSVEIGKELDDFILEKDINQLEELTLGHKDYVIGFEFAALDYSDPSRNKYAYKMEGLNPDWTYVNADNRQISYTNLSSGEYTFRVKGSNKDGVWNQQGKSLKIIVKPAPWLSWWAYLLYALFTLCVTLWFLKRKDQANLRITNMLKYEVKKQTKELQVQKQTVETLLAKKNELFANVSHEFRTPLTLILGPVNKLLNSHLPHSDINALKMVNRNANRLLTMIEQILQIAKISDFDKIKFQTINTQKHVRDIVASFTDSAKEKRIDLKLNDNDNANIKVSKDALDIILSNLLSNAIKYTPRGGSIEINATKANNQFHLNVKDSGCGLDEKQQKEIFNRFKRLDLHQNIEGIGIGLSVVEELLKVNNATIEITSQLGAGSVFAVTFYCSEEEVAETDANTSNLLVKQLSYEAKQTQEVEQAIEKIGNKRNDTILIIEDNHDMRAHIADSLKQHYYCLLADRGKKGVALAIEHVPDVIICDVMMPEMDGFHVSRILRSDGRTSHIPLMLLTALDDRESRIRGWREHVDVYLTKPFDVQELLLQLENILVIRNILKKKAGKTFDERGNSNRIDMPLKDKQFVDKLNKLIINKYKNPNYLRPQMASDMAISERQLQRKLKALIDINPMDLLREFRLKQSATMLKDGYQVGITSDECGFSSVTYFSQCFKANYGMSPKVYQTTCKKNN